MEQWKYENLTIDERWKSMNSTICLKIYLILNLQQPNEIEYLIEDFIDQGSINIIYEQPKRVNHYL